MVVSNALGFVLGLAVATSVLGVGAALAGLALTGVGGWVAYGIAAVPLVMGLHLLGWLQLPMLRTTGVQTRRGFFGAFVTALLVWAVIAPCGTPVLAATLSYAAYEGSLLYGAGLLFLYGLGAGLPVLLLGTVVGDFARRLDRHGWRIWVDRTTGVALVGLGLYLVWIA
jgi:cytochrome c biogenesis protein CcdA